jgi:hypothetical protein
MYYCMRIERESEWGNQLCVTLVTSQGVRVISTCANTRVCAGTVSQISPISTESVCLRVHTVTPKKTPTNTSNTKKTDQCMSSIDRKSFICTEVGKHILRRKKKNMYTHRHTSMHVGMYDCMRSESEPELGNQLSGILRKASNQTCILVCLCMYMWGTRANQFHTHHQLKGVRVISACVCARVCWYYFTNLPTVSICLPVYTVTQKHIHTQTPH